MHSTSPNPADSLNEESKAAARLIELLKQEQAQLIGADIEGLTALTAEKANIVARMSELATLRHRKLAAVGFKANETGMQQWLKSPDAKASVNKSWAELLKLAQAAKALNRTNGILINKHMMRNQMALNVLQVNPQGGNFYGPNGQSTMATGSRNLVIG